MFFIRIFLILIFVVFSNTVWAKKINRDAKEIYCLAQNIYFEARGEPENGQFAVAAVTMNRVKSHKYPNTVCKVVWQHSQFSWTNDGKSDRPRNKRAWHRARKIAYMVYSRYFTIQKKTHGAWDLTRGALHYYSPSLTRFGRTKERSPQ